MELMGHAKRCASVFLLCAVALVNPGLARAAMAEDFPALRVERSPAGEGRLRVLSARTGAVILDRLEAAYPNEGYVTVYRDQFGGVIDAEDVTALQLADFIDDELAEVEEQADKRNILVTTRDVAGDVQVQASKSLMDLAIGNLLRNAIMHNIRQAPNGGGDHGAVRVAALEGDETACAHGFFLGVR